MNKTILFCLPLTCLLLIPSCANENKKIKEGNGTEHHPKEGNDTEHHCNLTLNIKKSKQDIKDSMFNPPKDSDVTLVPLDQMKYFIVDVKNRKEEYVLDKASDREWKIISSSKNATERTTTALSQSIKRFQQGNATACLKLMKDEKGNFYGLVYSLLKGTSLNSLGPVTKTELENWIKNDTQIKINFPEVNANKHFDDKGNFIIE